MARRTSVEGSLPAVYQCDTDIIGEVSVLAEVELIEVTTAALAAVGLAGTTVRLSDRRFLSALADSVALPQESWSTLFIGLDKLDKIGWDGVRRELVDDRKLPATESTGWPTNISHLRAALGPRTVR